MPARPLVCGFAVILLTAAAAFAQTPTGEQLPGTTRLELAEPLDVVMVRGINRFAERELAAAPESRTKYWKRDFSSREAYAASVAPNRARLREILGVVDERVPSPRLWGTRATNLVGDVEARNVRWDVMEGVSAEGIGLRCDWLLSRSGDTPRAVVIVVPDADQLPESLAGFVSDVPSTDQLALRLAQHGCAVLVPTLLSRDSRWSGNPDIRFTNLTHREFLYRTSFELGRHPIGYEIQKILAAVDLAVQARGELSASELPIIVAGIGEGGLLAFHAAAVDPRIEGCYVSGYFSEREQVWQEPIYRNVWNQLSEFGDSDVASLIAPRSLILDASQAPESSGPPQPKEGQRNVAAPGVIRTPGVEAVKREYLRAYPHFESLNAGGRIVLTGLSDADRTQEDGLHGLLSVCGIKSFIPAPKLASRPTFDLDAAGMRQRRQLEELIGHTQRLLHRSDKVRQKLWANVDRSSVEKWEASAASSRAMVHDEMIGRLSLPPTPFNPHSRKVIEEPTHVGYEVVLDVESAEDHPALDARIFAGGILLLPGNLQPGEKRPVVVCQHGLEGTPMDTITEDKSQRAWAAYKGFSTELVRRGFIVYAPQNPYRGFDEFRVIQRKSNPLGRSLFSYIIEQHRQTLKWLATLPYVDHERIAFYGLSYGGKTAVRVPPLLANSLNSSVSTPDSPTYCLSICSADFNEWIRKNVSAEDRYSYVFTQEYEMQEWNMGHVAGYAELCWLMAPRSFMVERGHDDGVAPDEWVGWEFAKVRRHYDKLGIGDKTEIEWFDGPHTINGQGTYRFLHRHLNWPEPKP